MVLLGDPVFCLRQGEQSTSPCPSRPIVKGDAGSSSSSSCGGSEGSPRNQSNIGITWHRKNVTAAERSVGQLAR